MIPVQSTTILSISLCFVLAHRYYIRSSFFSLLSLLNFVWYVVLGSVSCSFNCNYIETRLRHPTVPSPHSHCTKSVGQLICIPAEQFTVRLAREDQL